MTGAAELVVHDALETITSESYNLSSFTPKTTVFISESFAGAERITFLALPTKCFDAASVVLKTPVDSKTISTPYFFHSIFPVFLSYRKIISLPFSKTFIFP
jgi:hypothetical protein